ncbi:MAG: AAA family ATPase [Cyanobacteria bacterium P01_F01_bin.150]
MYGANASGKSNVLSALDFMKESVIDSHRRWEPVLVKMITTSTASALF